MTITIIQGREITRPDTTPLTSSILDHATVVDMDDDFGLVNNAGLWPSYNCLDIAVQTPMCPDPLMDSSDEPKEFAFASWQPAFQFAAYQGVQCSAVGLEEGDMLSEITRVARLNEGRLIEQALVETRFAAQNVAPGQPGNPGEWDAPDALNAGGTLTVKTGVALLEAYAATKYAGVPTLHLPRAAVTLLEATGLVTWEGDKAFTKNGSKIAMGGGYDQQIFDGVDASADWTLWATGEVMVQRAGDPDIHQYNIVPGTVDLSSDAESGFTDNTVLALVEQTYRVAVDCFAASIEVAGWTA